LALKNKEVLMRKLLWLPVVLFAICQLLGVAPMAKADGQWPLIYDSAQKKWSDFATVEAALKQSQIVYVGEIHNHAWGHRLELQLLEKFFAGQHNIAVAFEMFERDVQAIMDGYIAGQTSEEFFTANSRPWGNYATDYRPLVQFAQSYRLPVLAMNVPRRYAEYAAKGKDDALWLMPALEKSFMAEQILALEGKYKQKFYETMQNHVPPEIIERYYRSQCLKDDTMAKSIAEFLKTHPEAGVISYTGAFHSDEYLGLVEKVRMQMPTLKRLLVSIVPVSGESVPDPENYSHLADFVLFAPESASKQNSAMDTVEQLTIEFSR
jgi:uncharacterized iron-regulated protein